MPTGYTAAIADGISFEKFVWDCARAFGALVTMRDDPTDTPIPEVFTPAPYYAESLEQARSELARLKAMTTREISAACAADFAQAMQRHCERIAESTELRNKYNAMLAKVVQWSPPTPDHAELQKFMADQLRQSIDFDCCIRYEVEPQKREPQAWHAAALVEAQRSVDYCENGFREELERVAKRNAWVKALRESVPPAP